MFEVTTFSINKTSIEPPLIQFVYTILITKFWPCLIANIILKVDMLSFLTSVVMVSDQMHNVL